MVERDRPSGAVIYVRVSTEEQAAGPLNLENQEKRCRRYCEQNGFAVIQVFVDPGKSARSTDRPQFQEMLAFCKKHRHEVGYVVVQDLSRLARNNQHQAETINQLCLQGIRLCSTYESNIDETAAGKLAANMYGSINQYFSDSLSEKMQDVTRASVIAGRFPWPAPIGYQNIPSSNGHSNIVPDETRAPFVRRAFELVASGLYSKAAVREMVTELGLRTRKGKKLSPQTFDAMLTKPVYCGWVAPPSMPDVRVKGLHEPLISEDLFNTVQRVLSGKKTIAAPKKKHNPNFPLKWFVKCGECGTPLTGAFVKGRSRKYPRYWCRNKSCRKVSLSKATLESEFLRLLRRLQPNRSTVSSFPRIAGKVWAKKQGDIEAETKRCTSKLEELRYLKSQLLRDKLRREISSADYQEENAKLVEEIAIVEQQLEGVSSNKASLDSFVRFAELMLANVATAWEKAKPEQRMRVQNLLFPGGIRYSGAGNFLNPSSSSLFNMLEEMSSEEGMLASPTGFEPVLPP